MGISWGAILQSTRYPIRGTKSCLVHSYCSVTMSSLGSSHYSTWAGRACEPMRREISLLIL